jgi:hypothetical protein
LPPDLALVGLPAELTIPNKYQRGSFEFNLGLVVSKSSLATHRFAIETVLRQSIWQLVLMEFERDLISRQDPKARKKRPSISDNSTFLSNTNTETIESFVDDESNLDRARTESVASVLSGGVILSPRQQ